MKKKAIKKKSSPAPSRLLRASGYVRNGGIGILLFTLGLVGVNGFAETTDTALLRNLKCVGAAWGKKCDLGVPTSIGSIVGIVIQAVLTLLGIIFLILTIYAGFLWMTAGGEKEKVEKAQSMLTQAVIGLIIILAAQGFTYWVLSTLGTNIS